MNQLRTTQAVANTTLMMEAISSSEITVLTRAGILRMLYLILYRSFKLSIRVLHLLFNGFEVFTAITMKKVVLWDVAPCKSRKNWCFGEIYRFHVQG
jgi:hypothetical protein